MKVSSINKKALCKVFSLLLIISCTLGCSKYSWENGRYYDKSNKISMQFPTNWALVKKEGDATYFKNSENTAVIIILAGSMPVTLDEFINEGINKGHLNEAEKVDLTIGGMKAYRFTRRQVNDSNGQNSHVSYFLLQNNILCEIKIIASAEYFASNENELTAIAEGLRFES